MAVKMTEVNVSGRVAMRSLERVSYTEYHLSGTPAGHWERVNSFAEVYDEAILMVTELGIQVVQEKLYGPVANRAELLETRTRTLARHGLDRTLPCTYLDGSPARGGAWTGFQLWGVVSRDFERPAVATVHDRGEHPGRIWYGPGFRMLYLPGIRGEHPDGRLDGCVTEQAERMFTTANRTLQEFDFSFQHLIRTWIYLGRILDWYGEFNRVRTRHYSKTGLAAFPASTAIQGKSLDEECLMDALALEVYWKDAVKVEAVTSTSRQNQAFSYGSAFSRALSLTIEERQTLYISGTSSINSQGMTAHFGDAEAQALEMLLSVSAILEPYGAGLDNIASATLFCKNAAAYSAYERVTRLLGVGVFPTVAVCADVCRGELLMEMEAIALI